MSLHRPLDGHATMDEPATMDEQATSDRLATPISTPTATAGPGPSATPEALDALVTERADPRYAHLDVASVGELAALMNEADASVPLAIGAAMGAIVPAIEAITGRLARRGRLRYVGAGTAGRLGVLDASECPPTFGTPPELVQGIIAGGPEAIVAAQEGVEDDLDAGARAIEADDIGPLDAVVGVAASGRTPFVIGALRAARTRGALTVALSCNSDAPISREAELAIEIPVGPEVLAGSTRLKAGTAQKLVLNMISTIAMVRLGKTWGNLMVDLRATNEKLRERAIRIVQQVTGVDREVAVRALQAADWEVKPAALMVGRGLSIDEARERLARDGRLRVALEEAS